MGNRDDIDDMSTTNSVYLTSVLKLIDKYDLYGLVAYPKHHKQSDVPDIYRLAAKTKVIFLYSLYFKYFFSSQVIIYTNQIREPLLRSLF